MNLESFVLDLQKKSSPGIGGKVILSGLELLAKVYKRGVICKREKALKSRIKLDVPVVSVGNITAGGTGKTPCIIRVGRADESLRNPSGGFVERIQKRF
ncbi:MAG: tetraacyldisaccharide 4'-kinase [Dialister sp.]